ncbi:MAG: hypothetical protein ACU837_06565 [Gammaproteobacteria bacterium]
MSADTLLDSIENLKNEEITRQAAARKKREEFKQTIEQVKASKNVDDTIRFLTGQMLEAQEQAEERMSSAQDAENQAQKALAVLEKTAEEVNQALITEKEKKDALASAMSALTDAKKTKEDKEKRHRDNPGDEKLTKEFTDADAKFIELEKEMKTAEASLIAATEAKNNAETQFDGTKLNVEHALKFANEAREEEEKLLATFGKLNQGVEVVRSISSDAWSRFVDKITPDHAISLSLVAVGGVGIFVLSKVVSEDFLRLIQYVDVARGLITFMVAMITVTLAIVLSIYPIISADNKEAKTDIKERFIMGKEVLMVFVGILGTIVGFYYASDHKSAGNDEQWVSKFLVNPSEINAGGDFTLTMLLTAGLAPYHYEISSDPAGIQAAGETLEKFMQVTLKAPANLEQDTRYTINLKVSDSTGNPILQTEKTITVKQLAIATPPDNRTSSPGLVLEPSTVTIGKTFKLTGTLPPGTTYAISSDPPLNFALDGSRSVTRKSDSGQVSETFTVPAGSLPDTYELTIKLTDSAGKSSGAMVKALTVTAE